MASIEVIQRASLQIPACGREPNACGYSMRCRGSSRLLEPAEGSNVRTSKEQGHLKPPRDVRPAAATPTLRSLLLASGSSAAVLFMRPPILHPVDPVLSCLGILRSERVTGGRLQPLLLDFCVCVCFCCRSPRRRNGAGPNFKTELRGRELSCAAGAPASDGRIGWIGGLQLQLSGV